MASAASQAAIVFSGSGVPQASMAAPPTSSSVRSTVKPNLLAAASSTRSASRITSGPMPSPAKTAMRWLRVIFFRSYARLRSTASEDNSGQQPQSVFMKVAEASGSGR